MVDPFQEFLEIADAMLVHKMTSLLDRHGADSYVVEYSFGQGAAYVSPMMEHLKRMARNRLKRCVTGYIPIGYYPTKEAASEAARSFDDLMKRRGISARIKIRTLKASRRNRKKGQGNKHQNSRRNKKK